MIQVMRSVEELAVQTWRGENTGAPLLQMLREAVGENSGMTRSGASSPSQRILIDAGAFTLFEDIAGQIASQFTMATDIRPNRAPEVNLLAWAAVFAAARDRGEVTDLQVIVASARCESWADRIRDYFDRPVVKEILVPCPHCGLRYVLNSDGDRVAALNATLQPGQEMLVECGNCRQQWVGDFSVIDLGLAAGLPLDVDGIRDARQVS